MINTKDRETIIKSSQTANLLVQDLRDLVGSADPLLSDVALEILKQATDLEQRLKRLEAISREVKDE